MITNITPSDVCQHCGKRSDDVKHRRQRTAYHDDTLNFATLCDECQKESSKYWQERWDEYYSSVL